jgi:hypothetical protein
MGKGAYLNNTGSKWFQGYSKRCKHVQRKGGMYRRCRHPKRTEEYENFGICEEKTCPRLKGKKMTKQAKL